MKTIETAAVTRDSDKFMLRLPQGMREEIAQAARTNSRSMNAEVVARLRGSLAGDIPHLPSEANLDKFADLIAEKVVRKMDRK